MNDISRRVIDSFNAQGMTMTLGASLVLVSDGEVHIALAFSPRLSQQHGYVHVGAITSVVESACGYAALTKASTEEEVVTAEFKINLLRPALGAHFLAIGSVQSAGRLLTVCTGEVRAFPENGSSHKMIAIMQATIARVSRLPSH
jgi:uncharacterized protein (TIGR00369 family)